MTIDISNNDPRISYSVASGVTQTTFAVPFEFFDDSDLNVYVDGVLKTITADYTLTGGDGSTGTVTMTVVGASGGSTVSLTRDTTIERITDFTAGVDINRAALNTQLDTLTAISADVKDLAERAIRVEDVEVAPSLVLPSIADRSGKTLAFNSTTGAVEAGPSISDVQTLLAASADIATLADIEDGTDATDAIQTVASISSDVTAVLGISSDIASVGPIASDVTTVASNISDIQNASANAATATTKASEAAASATSAASSATSAANSAAAAASAFDNFDDTYLGSKTSNPTVDNDGDPLTEGDLYFNNTNNEMRVYDGANWIPASSSGTASLVNYNYTATASQTVFSGADDNALSLSYIQANIIVTLNGVFLEGGGTDYTATDGTSITLTSAASAGDELNIVSFKSFTVADVYTKTQSDSRYIAVGTPTGGGLFKGENGEVGSSAGDIFRINEQTLNTSTTIDADENASATGPLAIATGVTLTVTSGGNLSIV